MKSVNLHYSGSPGIQVSPYVTKPLQSGRICRGNGCKDLSVFVGSRLIGRSHVGSSLLWDSIKKKKKPWFCCLHRSPCARKVIQRIVGQKNVRCLAFISKIRVKFRFKCIFSRLFRGPNATRARVNWSVLDYLPMLRFGLCPISPDSALSEIVSLVLNLCFLLLIIEKSSQESNYFFFTSNY